MNLMSCVVFFLRYFRKLHYALLFKVQNPLLSQAGFLEYKACLPIFHSYPPSFIYFFFAPTIADF